MHASSTIVVEVEVAKIGRLPVMLRGKVAKYVMGLCWTPPTVAFWSGMTVLESSVKIPLTGEDDALNSLIKTGCRDSVDSIAGT